LPSIHVLVQHGYLGVDLFFVLSGFIIAHVYLYDLVPARAKPLCIFLWHRFVRLFPAHATILLGLVVLVAGGRSAGFDFNEPQHWNYRDLPWHFLMVHAWGTTDIAGWNAPSWSISVEWFAYLPFPAVTAGTLALPRRAALPLAFATLLIGAVLFDVYRWSIEAAWIGPPALLRVASEFICGVLLYRAVRIDRTSLSLVQSDWLAFGGLLGFCAGAFFSANDFVLIACLAVLIAGVSGPGTGVRVVFGCRPAVWLGGISYSTYLVHFPVLLVLRHVTDHISFLRATESESIRLTLFVGSLGIVIGAASLLYYVVENPSRRRLRGLFGKLATQPSRSDALPAFHDVPVEFAEVKQGP
jgi:peptidoglycan/LPS O-acetylase OafA/YrhL